LKEITSVTAASLGGQFHGSLFSMILNAGLMVQFVLLLLLFFSVVSWAIIFMKYRSMKKVKRENDLFLDVYMKSNKLSDIFPESKKYKHSSIAEVFQAGYTELVKITKVMRG
jgi:biopolymer transport protein TolQ